MSTDLNLNPASFVTLGSNLPSRKTGLLLVKWKITPSSCSIVSTGIKYNNVIFSIKNNKVLR